MLTNPNAPDIVSSREEGSMPRLTKSVVDALTPPAVGQKYCWDSELKGFGVRVLPTGLKVFMLQYRNSEGVSKRLKIGRYGVLTPDEARTQAKVHLGDVARGTDPQEARAAAKAAPTIGEICDWYLVEAEAGRLLGRKRRPIKASTLRMDRSRIECHIKPMIGSRKVAKLKTADFERLQADIAEGKSAAKKGAGRGRNTEGGAGAASRTIATLHAILAHAARMGEIDSNPANGVRRLASNEKERRLKAAELVELGKAMRLSAERGEHPVGLAAVRYLLLTGFRLNESQKLERSWVDDEGSYVLFPDTKSDGQVRAIGSAARAVVRQQARIAGCPYVFPSDYGDSHYKQVPDLVERLRRLARLEDVTPHVFRHTFGSVAGDLGYSELTIAAMLGHGKRGVTQGYIHIDELLRSAIETVSQRIADLLDGKRETVIDQI
jgi:integrase